MKSLIISNKKAIISVILFIGFLFVNYRRGDTPFNFDSRHIRESQYVYVQEGHYAEMAKNAYETGYPLLLNNPDGNYKKFDPGYCDPGYPLLISYLSILGFKIQDIHSFAKLNLTILWLTLFALIAVNFRLFLNPFVAAPLYYLFTVYTTAFGLKGAVSLVDQHGLVSAFTIVLIIISIMLSRLKTFNWKAYFFIAFLGGLMALFRNYFAYGALAILFVHMTYFIVQNKKWKLIPWAVALVPALYLIQSFTFKYTQTLSYAHASSFEKTIKSEAGKEPSEHGIWHTFYVGLGYYENKWGIKWKDEVGEEHSARFNAKLPPAERKDHYEVMKILYFKYISENPLETLRNYSRKALAVVYRAPMLILRPLMFLFLLWITGIVLLRKRMLPLHGNNQVLFLVLGLTVTGLFFIIPIISTPGFSNETITGLYFTLTVWFGYLLNDLLPAYFNKIVELKALLVRRSSPSI